MEEHDKFHMEEPSKYRAILLICIILSFCGIFTGVFTEDAIDGTRGGAVSVMVALLTLFISKGYGAKVYGALTTPIVGARISDDDVIRAIRYRLEFDAKSQKLQSLYLAWCTAIGTLVWGFGDIPTNMLIGVRPALVIWLRSLFS